eukprot:EG_transcript_27374
MAALLRPEPLPRKQTVWSAAEEELLGMLVALGLDDGVITRWLDVGDRRRVMRHRAAQGLQPPCQFGGTRVAPATPKKPEKRAAAATPSSSAKKRRRAVGGRCGVRGAAGGGLLPASRTFFLPPRPPPHLLMSSPPVLDFGWVVATGALGRRIF